MFTLIQRLTLREFLVLQMPALGTAFVVAELFYKFGSFALECVAFLATWAVFDAGIQGGRRLLSRS